MNVLCSVTALSWELSNAMFHCVVKPDIYFYNNSEVRLYLTHVHYSIPRSGVLWCNLFRRQWPLNVHAFSTAKVWLSFTLILDFRWMLTFFLHAPFQFGYRSTAFALLMWQISLNSANKLKTLVNNSCEKSVAGFCFIKRDRNYNAQYRSSHMRKTEKS